jgi:SOS response regulatory protein OraA/RecX
MTKSIHVIKDIEMKKKGILLLVDEEEFFLSPDSYSDAYYYPGKELTKEEYQDLKRASRDKKAKDYLVKLVSSRRYTHKELYDKIENKYHLGYKENELLLLPYVQAHIIDDKAYALDYCESKIAQGYGKRYLLEKLKAKGIKDSILQDKELEELFVISLDQIEPLINKANKSKKNKTIEERKTSIMQLLIRRGYTSSQAKGAIDHFYSSLSQEEKKEEERNRVNLLKKEADKCYNFLVRQNRYDARKKKDAFIKKLLAKGFHYDEIMTILTEDYPFYD